MGECYMFRSHRQSSGIRMDDLKRKYMVRVGHQMGLNSHTILIARSEGQGLAGSSQ